MRVRCLPTFNKLSRPAFNRHSLPTRLQRCHKRPSLRAASSQKEEELANQDLSPPKAIENLLVPETTKDAMHGTEPSTSGIEDSNMAKAGALLVLLSPFFFWGTSMVAMKALSPHTAPLFVSAVRMLPAGAVLVAWGAWDKRPQPQGWKAWAWIAVFGLADATCFQGFLAEGLQRTSAGLGSVIIDSQPLSVALLASVLFGERLSLAGYIGLAVGVFGLCLLELPPGSLPELLHLGTSSTGELAEPSLVASSISSSGSWSIWDSGEWWMLLAAQSMAVGTVLVRYVTKYADPIMATGYHMLLGGIPLLLLSAQQESSELAERLPLLTGSDYLLLFYISMLGSAASYGVFFLNASRGNLTALSSLTFSTPCFAAATGYLLLGENLTPAQLVGAAVTLAGVFFINYKQANAN